MSNDATNEVGGHLLTLAALIVQLDGLILIVT